MIDKIIENSRRCRLKKKVHPITRKRAPEGMWLVTVSVGFYRSLQQRNPGWHLSEGAVGALGMLEQLGLIKSFERSPGIYEGHPDEPLGYFFIGEAQLNKITQLTNSA